MLQEKDEHIQSVITHRHKRDDYTDIHMCLDYFGTYVLAFNTAHCQIRPPQQTGILPDWQNITTK